MVMARIGLELGSSSGRERVMVRVIDRVLGLAFGIWFGRVVKVRVTASVGEGNVKGVGFGLESGLLRSLGYS